MKLSLPVLRHVAALRHGDITHGLNVSHFDPENPVEQKKALMSSILKV